ncbi:MAG TPA: FeoA family protein [Steroidobacteraceae bacterium]|jgi:ferrous iron transport protein A|nr:FeoA family protein [Steroidobacteraceae bacterium]
MDSHVDWHAIDRELALAADVRSLASLHKGERGVVTAVGVNGAAGVTIGDVAGSTIARRLLEVGFVPGERIEVIEEIRPGGDPIAVRIGSSMFALRRREAQAVLVRLERSEAV